MDLEGRILGIDWGERNIGIAISDPFNTFALPLLTMENTERISVYKQILILAREKKVKIIVFGLPLMLDGKDTETSRKIRNFISGFSDFIRENNIEGLSQTDNDQIKEIIIETITESYSTTEAKSLYSHNYNHEKKTKSRKKQDKDFKKIKDPLSAQIILETFIMKKKQK